MHHGALHVRGEVPWGMLHCATAALSVSTLNARGDGAPARGHIVGEGLAQVRLARQPKVRDLHRLVVHQQVLCARDGHSLIRRGLPRQPTGSCTSGTPAHALLQGSCLCMLQRHQKPYMP